MIEVKGELISLKSLIQIYYEGKNPWYGNRIFFKYADGNKISIGVKDYKEYEDIRDKVLKTLEGGSNG